MKVKIKDLISQIIADEELSIEDLKKENIKVLKYNKEYTYKKDNE